MSRLKSLLGHLLIGIIRSYQYLLSPWLGQHCRFSPTCSHYAVTAIQSHGPFKGIFLAGSRLAKCHPWHAGGEDPVPETPDQKKLVNK